MPNSSKERTEKNAHLTDGTQPTQNYTDYQHGDSNPNQSETIPTPVPAPKDSGWDSLNIARARIIKMQHTSYFLFFLPLSMILIARSLGFISPQRFHHDIISMDVHHFQGHFL